MTEEEIPMFIPLWLDPETPSVEDAAAKMAKVSPEQMLLDCIRQELEDNPQALAIVAREHADALPWWQWRKRRYWRRWADLAWCYEPGQS